MRTPHWTVTKQAHQSLLPKETKQETHRRKAGEAEAKLKSEIREARAREWPTEKEATK